MPLVDQARLYNWTGNVGISGGIPDGAGYTVKNLSAGAGLSTVQTALRSAAKNTIIHLPAGDYNWSGMLDFQGTADNLILRGDVDGNGNPSTKITTNSYIYIRRNWTDTSGTSVALSANATAGSKSFAVASVPAWLVAGELYCLTQQDDPAFVSAEGEENAQVDIAGCAAVQCVRVTGISGKTITIDMPVCYAFSTARKAKLLPNFYDPASNQHSAKGIGIEDLEITAKGVSGDTDILFFQGCDSCWVKNCKLIKPGRIAIHTVGAYRCEFRHNYITGSSFSGPGQGYGIALYYQSAGCLIEDNILEGLHVALQCNYGSTGNVFAYNYEKSGFSVSHQQPAFDTHGCHTWFTLFEGNYCEDKILLDYIHGSGSHNTALRNKVNGSSTTSPPETYDQCCCEIACYNRYCNIVGNIFGADGFHAKYACEYPAPWNASDDKPIFSIGYDGQTGNNDSLSECNLVRKLNYNAVDGTIPSGEASSETLPKSYYLTAAPPFFGSLTWPPFDPQGPPPAKAENIPAGYRFINGVDPGGTPIPPDEIPPEPIPPEPEPVPPATYNKWMQKQYDWTRANPPTPD